MSAGYHLAKIEVETLTKKPAQNEQLDLYALAKIAENVDIKSRPAPGMFNFEEKAKRSAWQKLIDEGLSADEAAKRYIELVEELKKKYGVRELDPEKEKDLIARVAEAKSKVGAA